MPVVLVCNGNLNVVEHRLSGSWIEQRYDLREPGTLRRAEVRPLRPRTTTAQYRHYMTLEFRRRQCCH